MKRRNFFKKGIGILGIMGIVKTLPGDPSPVSPDSILMEPIKETVPDDLIRLHIRDFIKRTIKQEMEWRDLGIPQELKQFVIKAIYDEVIEKDEDQFLMMWKTDKMEHHDLIWIMKNAVQCTVNQRLKEFKIRREGNRTVLSKN